MMDWPEILGGGVGLTAIGTAIGAVASRVIASRTASRQAQAREHVADLEHDARIAKILRDELETYRSRVEILERREDEREDEIEGLRVATENCHQLHAQSEARAAELAKDREDCKRDLGRLRDEVREIGRLVRGPRSTPPSERSPVSGRTLLVVEDDADSRRSLSQLLDALGHRVLTAASVTEAVAVLADEERVDLVLCDWLMPEHSGAELVEILRRGKHRTPIVIVTGAPTMVPADLGLVVLPKPVSQQALASVIARVLDDTGRFQVVT